MLTLREAVIEQPFRDRSYRRHRRNVSYSLNALPYYCMQLLILLLFLWSVRYTTVLSSSITSKLT